MLKRAKVAHLTDDRLLAPDIAAAAELVRLGSLVEAAGGDLLPRIEIQETR